MIRIYKYKSVLFMVLRLEIASNEYRLLDINKFKLLGYQVVQKGIMDIAVYSGSQCILVFVLFISHRCKKKK